MRYMEICMQDISMYGNCGDEELKIFCLIFVYNLIISNSYVCHQQMCMM
jgi:hypothetical protein